MKYTVINPSLTRFPVEQGEVRPHVPRITSGPPRTILPDPSPVELVTNFAQAMETWAGAGFPTVTGEQYQERSRICDGCELWDGKARLGLGKCMAPGCGCTSFKRWLKTERCKHPAGAKWPLLA